MQLCISSLLRPCDNFVQGTDWNVCLPLWYKTAKTAQCLSFQGFVREHSQTNTQSSISHLQGQTMRSKGVWNAYENQRFPSLLLGLSDGPCKPSWMIPSLSFPSTCYNRSHTRPSLKYPVGEPLSHISSPFPYKRTKWTRNGRKSREANQLKCSGSC